MTSERYPDLFNSLELSVSQKPWHPGVTTTELHKKEASIPKDYQNCQKYWHFRYMDTYEVSNTKKYQPHWCIDKQEVLMSKTCT